MKCQLHIENNLFFTNVQGTFSSSRAWHWLISNVLKYAFVFIAEVGILSFWPLKDVFEGCCEGISLGLILEAECCCSLVGIQNLKLGPNQGLMS